MKAKSIRLILAMVACICIVNLPITLFSQSTLYVTMSGNDNNSGNSWNNAFRTVRKALSSATNGGQIWIAKGLFYPDEGPGANDNDRNALFQVGSGVKIYGGFVGTETSIDERITGSRTNFSGDIQQDGIDSNNAKMLVSIVDKQNVVLDGLVFERIFDTAAIEAGHSAVSIQFSSYLINNCLFRNNKTNSGAALYSVAYNTTGIVNGCIFSNNVGTAASNIIPTTLFFSTQNDKITNCIFDKNGPGGPACMLNGAEQVWNCNFLQNPGGAILYGSSYATIFIRNSIFIGNTSSYLTGESQNPISIKNCIMDYAPTVGGTGVFENLYGLAPGFADGVHGNYRLSSCAFAINQGAPGNPSATDADGRPRVAYGITDIGAYEYNGTPDPTILYVNKAATGLANGSSWQNAYTNLNDALSRANSCMGVKAIWVAGGVYYPDEGAGKTNDDRNSSFSPPRNFLRLYGGFAGTETQLSERNPGDNHTTVLSGDIQQDNIATNNSYHVFRNIIVTDTTFVMDGFTIQDGYAENPDAASSNSYGSGMLLQQNDGVFQNCIITKNTATYGSALVVWASKASFTNCVITGNTTLNSSGVIVINTNSPSFINCTIASNTINATNKAPVFSDNVSSPVFKNCIVTGYSPAISGGTPVVSFSLIQNASPFAGQGNMIGDPMFLNAANGDLRLSYCSPVINAATATGAPATDILGVVRGGVGGYDMGAYEAENSQPNILYVKSNATGLNNGSSWENAYTNLSDAVNAASNCYWYQQIWVARGTYYPSKTNNRNMAVTGRNRLSMYGGFLGNESNLSQRVYVDSNRTIISGEIQQDNNPINNSARVVSLSNLDSSFTLDGFVIQDGFTNTIFPEDQTRGSGIYISNCGAVNIINCIIQKNLAIAAPAIYVGNSNPRILGCVIKNNTTANYNGAVWLDNASALINHCTIANNYINGSDYIVLHMSGSSSPTITNSIFRGTSPSIRGGSPSVSYSIIQNPSVWPGTNNGNSDPLFVNEAAGNLHVQRCSPARDNANKADYNPVFDLDNRNFHPAFNAVTIGAYQRDIATYLFVDQAASGDGDGTSWYGAYKSFSEAMTQVNRCSIATLYVAEGTYINPVFLFDYKFLTIYGSYGAMGSSFPDFDAHPTILKGAVQASKSVIINGVKVVQ